LSILLIFTVLSNAFVVALFLEFNVELLIASAIS
jgi:hypothetical protein